MSNVGSLEHYGFRSKFVQIGRVNLLASVAGDRVALADPAKRSDSAFVV